MSDADRLTPASSDDLADALAFALRYSGRKRTNDAGEMMAAIVAKRLVEHLERSGFVVMKKPPIGGGAAITRRAWRCCASRASQPKFFSKIGLGILQKLERLPKRQVRICQKQYNTFRT